jgi:arylsulfatase A-like enzyme
MRRIPLVVALAAALSLIASVPLSHALTSTETGSVPASKAPNIVVVMTDDQDVATLQYMPHVKQLLIDRGVQFTHHTVVYPLCCPSRSAYLSGQVGHNNHVRGNIAPAGGYDNLDTSETLPVWLSAAGYATEHLGKYPNGYDGHQHPATGGVPPGWTEWHGAVDPTTYEFYGYTLNENGVDVTHGATEADYQTDVLTGLATDFIQRRSQGDQPFFLDVAYLAPHWEFRPGTSGIVNVGDVEGGSGESSLGTPPVPAKRHLGMFTDVQAPRPPSFNEADVSDKPQFVQDTPLLTASQIDQIDRWYRKRLASLQAVDEGVAKIVQTLADTGELNNTYIVFTADNGWLQGEHRLALQKTHAYTESSTVPLVIAGPGVKAGGKVTDNTEHLDLTATILDLAGAKAEGHPLDGMSLVPYLSKPRLNLGRAAFQESSPDDAGYVSVRAGRWKYVEYNNGDRELYDLVADPYQLQSLHEDPSKAELIARLSALLEGFRTCKGSSCVVTGFKDGG